MDPFGTLPPSILLDIMKCIPDVYTLRSLQRASPLVNRILQEEGIAAEAIGDVLSSGYTLVSNQLLIRMAVLISWGPHPANIRLGSFECLQAVLNIAIPLSTSRFNSDKEQPGIHSLQSWEGLPVTALPRVLALSEQVQKLIHHCFHTLLARALASRPRRPIDSLYDTRLFFNVYKQARKSRLPVPPIVPIPPSKLIIPAPGAISPPSWGEQQLLEHGAWLF